MLEKSIVDSLIRNAMATMDIDAIKDAGDFQNVLCAKLNSSSGISSWKWRVGERYLTTGTTNKKSMTFSISGVYNDSFKVVIALVRVMDPPGNYLAFPYDVLQNGVRIELAISENSGTASTIDSLPVVYGVSIGLTDYAPYWVNADKGQDGWSRESFKLLREQVTNFRSVATIIEPDKGDLHNAIYRGERCHLSFALNWSIMWRNLEGGSRYVYVAPSSLVEHADEGVFIYDHDRGDPSFLPFLEVQTQEQWKRAHDKIDAKQRSLIRQKASVKAKEKFVSAHGSESAGQSKNRLVNKIDIDREREQVLLHWQHIDPDALLKKTHQIIRHINGKDPGYHVRAFHNPLGYKAMHGVEKGGKCAGCFYRTQLFMELKQVDRVSEKKRATIHLEHLIPVQALLEKIRVLLSRGASAEVIQRFLLQYSITVGMHHAQGCIAKEEGGGIIQKGLTSATNAFSKADAHYQRPFMRYVARPNVESKIYNVLTGGEIDFESYSHEQSRLDLIQVIEASGNRLGLMEIATNQDNGYALLAP